MTPRYEAITVLWDEIIAPYRDISVVRRLRPAAELLDAGADPEVLTRLLTGVAYEAVFQTLFLKDELADGEGADELDLLHEDLLSGDPSGHEGSDFVSGDA